MKHQPNLKKRMSTMKSQGINKAVIIISKIIEVFCWVGVALCAVLTVVTIVGHQELYAFLTSVDPSATTVSLQGLTLTSSAAFGGLTPGAFIIAWITSLLVLSLMAMIARNINLVFKTSAGETWFSQGNTPFQPDNVRMIREIGIFAIAIPVVEIAMSLVAAIVLGFDTVEINVDMTTIFFGLVALALSQYFSYGAQLETEVDGLV